jgi:hypothetical protein
MSERDVMKISAGMIALLLSLYPFLGAVEAVARWLIF